MGMGMLSGLSNVVFDVREHDHFHRQVCAFQLMEWDIECINYFFCAIIGAYLLLYIVEKRKSA